MQKYDNAIIFAASDISGVSYKKADTDLVIAADLGYKNAQNKSVYPDMVIGDFDSLGKLPEHKSVIKLPVEKDDTDTSFAVKKALDMGVKSIFVLGGLGGRLDHTFANIQLLDFIANKGAAGYLVNGGEMLTVIKNRKIRIHGSIGETISVFSLSDKSDGVYERGFKYTLNDAVIENSFPLGVSNELSETVGEISTDNGTLLIYAKDITTDFIYKNRHEYTRVNGLLNVYLQ